MITQHSKSHGRQMVYIESYDPPGVHSDTALKKQQNPKPPPPTKQKQSAEKSFTLRMPYLTEVFSSPSGF